MKTARYLVALPFLIVLAWLGTSSVSEQEGPHGGIMKRAANYRIEAGHTRANIFAFLYDRAMNEIPNKGITCTAVIDFTDNSAGNLDLVPYGKYAFQANMIDRNYKAFTVTFTKGGDTVSARYENTVFFPPTVEK